MTVRVDTTSIEGVLLFTPEKHGDQRGFFSEVFKSSILQELGITHPWLQDNHSMSAARGVVRGLHFQVPPRAQAKLVRVVRGEIFDVVVDIRTTSRTFGQYVAVNLSAENWRQVYAPAGMAHGFMTLTEHTEVIYKTSDEYAPECEGGLNWLDADLQIPWPIAPETAFVNSRDKAWPILRDLHPPF